MDEPQNSPFSFLSHVTHCPQHTGTGNEACEFSGCTLAWCSACSVRDDKRCALYERELNVSAALLFFEAFQQLLRTRHVPPIPHRARALF